MSSFASTQQVAGNFEEVVGPTIYPFFFSVEYLNR